MVLPFGRLVVIVVAALLARTQAGPALSLTEANFDEVASSRSGLLAVFLSTKRCFPCQEFVPAVLEAAETFAKPSLGNRLRRARVAFMDTDDDTYLPRRMRGLVPFRGLPQVLLLRGNRFVDMINTTAENITAKTIEAIVRKHTWSLSGMKHSLSRLTHFLPPPPPPPPVPFPPPKAWIEIMRWWKWSNEKFGEIAAYSTVQAYLFACAMVLATLLAAAALLYLLYKLAGVEFLMMFVPMLYGVLRGALKDYLSGRSAYKPLEVKVTRDDCEKPFGLMLGVTNYSGEFEVSFVQQGSPAAEAGLLAGDIVLEVNGEPAKKVLPHAMDQIKEVTTAELTLVVGRDPKFKQNFKPLSFKPVRLATEQASTSS